MLSNRMQKLIFILAIAGLFLAGVGIRRSVLNAQNAPGWSEVPFTMESALHFRIVRMLVEDGGLPEVDTDLQHPGGVDLTRLYSLSDEYVLSALIGLLPEFGSLTERLRWISLLWFCLGIPLIALWIGAITRSRWAGCISAAFYAVMIAAVIRSTGQELSRENFALPLLIGHMLFNTYARRSTSIRPTLLLSLASGVLLGMALVTWDLIQFYIFVFWLIEAVYMAISAKSGETRPSHRILIEVVVVVGIGLLSPYQRSHGLLISPLTILGLGLIVMSQIGNMISRQSPKRTSPILRRPWLLMVFILIAALGIGFFAGDLYNRNYNHFGRLLVAKMAHLNVKPADPALLDFDARMMWVPALNSATSKTVFLLFPYTLLLTVPLFLVVFRQVFKEHTDGRALAQLVAFLLVSSVAFLLFVRFHVFLAIFAAGVIGCGTHFVLKKADWKSWVLPPLVALALIGECNHVLSRPERWGRSLVYYRELKELLDWSAENIAEEPIVGNFGVSAMMLAYAGNPIVLHPKFETREIRDSFREYGRIMYKGDEYQLREWMEVRDSRYVVYSMGEFADHKPEWQMRYFFNALQPGEDAPARYFEYDETGLNLFRMVWQNRKYRVFRLTTEADEESARRLVLKARQAFESGRVREAEELAAKALLTDPNQKAAVKIIQHAGSLINQGFDGGE